jgi:DNA-binding transcriptional LysR family regulator
VDGSPVPESFEAVRNLGGGSVSICFFPYAGIKGLVESGFGYSILPQHALHGRNRFFQTYRIAGHRLTRSLALAMVRTDYPRKLTQAVADFLQKLLTTQA